MSKSKSRKRKRNPSYNPQKVIPPHPFPYKTTLGANNWSMKDQIKWNEAQKCEKFKLVNCVANAGCGKVIQRKGYRQHWRLVHANIYDANKTLRCLKLDSFNECWDNDIIGQDLDVINNSRGKQLKLQFKSLNPKKKQRLSMAQSTTLPISLSTFEYDVVNDQIKMNYLITRCFKEP